MESASSVQELQHLLKEEVDCFRSVLSVSRKSLERIDEMPIDVLNEMVNYRREWVERIQGLEVQRKSMPDEPRTPETVPLLSELSDLAVELVDVDKQIFARLQTRKLNYVRAMSANANGVAQQSRQTRSNNGTRKILDITQE